MVKTGFIQKMIYYLTEHEFKSSLFHLTFSDSKSIIKFSHLLIVFNSLILSLISGILISKNTSTPTTILTKLIESNKISVS